ncbi:MAG: glycine zipper domain-containing protein [Candidatus Methanospirareceae archaeon]
MKEEQSRFEKLEETVKKSLKSVVYAIIGGIIGLLLQNWGIIAVNLSVEVVGFIITCIGIGLTFWFVCTIGKDISDIRRDVSSLVSRVEEGFEKLVRVLQGRLTENPNNPSRNPERNEREKGGEIRTTGAGALAGMIVGGAIGLLGGPAGVILGGIIGALIGNQIEYEQEKERRKN